MKQSTIARSVECAGIGLHSGLPARIRLCPAEAETGIVFIPWNSEETSAPRDGAARARSEGIPARIASLRSSSRATTIGPARVSESECVNGEAGQIGTVEHLLASLYAHEIDNVRVEVEGPEIPTLDGSAGPLFEWVASAGRVEQAPERAVFVLGETIEIRDGNRWIQAEPCADLRITYAIDFDHALIGRQVFEMEALGAAQFERELARARTFGFETEVAALREAGLGLGGSLENTVVVGTSTILNEGGLRYPDEFVRHKVVDLLGDLALLGARLQAHVRVERGGHALHHRLVRALSEAMD